MTSTENELSTQVDLVARKVRYYLMSMLGKTPQEAYPWEFYNAVSYVLREVIMINWAATNHTINQKKARRLYYISMEFLPGRMLVHNISNVNAHPLMKEVVTKLGFDYRTVLHMESDPGLGNGGLGRLASCLMESLATQQYPAMAYGLRYQYGIFQQELWDGVQIEKPDMWLLNEHPWGLRTDGHAKRVKFAGVMKKSISSGGEALLDLEDFELVRALPFDYPIIGFAETPNFNVATLRLWSTKESPHNFHLQRYNAGQIGPAAENTALTDVLYPNDNHETGKRIRLKQEFLLVSASLQDIFRQHFEHYDTIDSFADKVRIQINDTHPALVVPELIRILMQHYNKSWHHALEITQQVTSYTNHTILSEALEKWNQERFAALLPRQYWVIEELNRQFCQKIRSLYPNEEEKVRRMSIIEGGQVQMANLSIVGSHKVNGVAKLHGQILKEETFADFAKIEPNKFTFVTNGVTQRHWLWSSNKILSEFISERIGDKWIVDFNEIIKLQNFAFDKKSQDELLDIKKRNKQRLLDLIYREQIDRDLQGREHPFTDKIHIDSLFDVQVKRVHEYKRQLMNALHLIMIYFNLLENPNSRKIKRTAIFAGKAAAGYTIAKYIIQLIYLIGKKVNNHPDLQDKLKVVYLENYSVTRAEIIIPGAELSEQISTAGMEASGTGNMKFAINGALTIGTEDGANIEMREAIGDTNWPFSFGAHADELAHLRRADSYNPWDFYLKDHKIKRAIDALKDGTFSRNEQEREALGALYDRLLLGYGGDRADRYFVLYDLKSYYETQKRVEELYLDQSKWAEISMHNIARMGPFSSDVAVKKYADEIWHLEKCPVDPEIISRIRRQHDESLS